MGTARQDIYEQLKFNLYQDDAVTGEAAGIAMGLVMLGTKSAAAIEVSRSVNQSVNRGRHGISPPCRPNEPNPNCFWSILCTSSPPPPGVASV